MSTVKNAISSRNDQLSKTVINMSDPNAAGRGSKFKGVGSMGYRRYFEKSDPYAEVIKFGKKVDYGAGGMMNSNELMEEHLK